MNIFENISVEISKEISKEMNKEISEIIHTTESYRIERIISAGDTSPEGFWYDQDEDEWILLASGNAVLCYDDGSKIELKTGDTLFIPAHEKHRVTYTSSEPKCIWICVFSKI